MSATASRDALVGRGGLPVLDRVLYALFARHADAARHDRDRKRYRGTDLDASFEVYLSRVYGCSWLVSLLVGTGAAGGLLALGATPALARLGDGVGLSPMGTTVVGAGVVLAATATAKWATVRAGGRYLAWRADLRATDISYTLPGAVRYLRVLSTGSDGRREMLRKVADNREAYGHTAVAFRKALNNAALTGSLNEGLRIVARDTPSRDALAPFLLKFREHADQGEAELERYLRMEGRMLSQQQARTRERAQRFLELVAELFIVLLVLPALLVIVVSVLSVISTDLTETVATPAGPITVRSLLVYGSAAFVLVTGALSASLVGSLRPPGHGERRYERPADPLGIVATAATNPASAAWVLAPVAAGITLALWAAGVDPVTVGSLGYASFAVPVGLVAVRRAGIDDAKDREIKDFIHAVSGHVSLGRPFPTAVEVVARDVDLGALNEDVADLAFNANLTTRDQELRADALDRFVERVGTPLAEQTVGLVTGALDAGGDVENVFETLQTEVGRLYHQKRALQSAMAVYVAVGWTTALLVVGIMVAVNTYVLSGFSQLAAVSGTEFGVAMNPEAIDLDAERYRFYVVTQATMLSCGWFAGTASRGRYAALLHSGALVAVATLVFLGVGMV